MISINREAMKIVRRVLEDAEALGVLVSRLSNGATVIDMGQRAPGGWLAAKYYTLVTLGGLAEVSYEPFPIGDVVLPAVRVMVDRPMEACVASQIAGWQLDPPGTPHAAIAAGPARALNHVAPDHYFELIDYRDQHDEAVVAIQTAEPITPRIAETIAHGCGIRTENVYILVAPNSSLVCAVQVAARIIEQTLHRLPEEGFDLTTVRYAQGYSVIAPLIQDEVAAMGRINDSLLYGGAATLYVEAEDDAIADVVKRITSSVARAYGRPFLEIFEDAGRDFYQIPLDLHSPAAVHINNLRTGRSFSAGAINYDVLRRSFFGA
ncbi:MAG: methenyltetrahydromethanopterin cyclohydrolase [Chloroflexi bacterium]|nr:methenyltetrahydromethanopterin cyclohydrolase [Chloroflexota bacterium]MBI5290700.1 methenyltetrahydromethanopterin cyclohydrolase [Chloroflexota bacterium]